MALQPDIGGWVLWGFLLVTVLQDSGQLSVERGFEGCMAPVSLVWLDPQRLHTCSNQICVLRTCLVGWVKSRGPGSLWRAASEAVCKLEVLCSPVTGSLS